MSFSVAVRTVVLDLDEGVAEYGVGTAITNASSVVGAYEEARLKAKVLVDRRPHFRLVERFRVIAGTPERMEAKLDVLAESARYFGYDLSWDQVVMHVKQEATEMGSGTLDLVVGRYGSIETTRGGESEFHPSSDRAPHLPGLIAADPIARDNVFLFHKTTDTRLHEVTRRSGANAVVAILLNENGNVAGSLEGNVVALLESGWVTPPRSSGNPLYAYRRELLEAGVIAEAPITEQQLAAAEAVAVINDLDGWRLVDL